MTTSAPPGPGGLQRALTKSRAGLGDRGFRALVLLAGYALMIILIAIAAFLVVKALPALNKDTAGFFSAKTWSPDDTPSHFGIEALLYGTVICSVIALVLAVPVSIGVAAFIAFYAPRRIAQLLGYLVDLLAAVPSIVYGLWGVLFLVNYSQDLQLWLARYFGWTHILSTEGGVGQSFFVAGVVLAVMILPIIAAITREIFLQVPQTQMEAAQALGATRWEVIRMAALPYGRSGITSAVVLGFGRALGETIAVALVLSANFGIVTRFLTPGGNTIAANIANQYGDAAKIGLGALIASGLVLFVLTLLVNFLARVIARQSVAAGGVV